MDFSLKHAYVVSIAFQRASKFSRRCCAERFLASLIPVGGCAVTYAFVGLGASAGRDGASDDVRSASRCRIHVIGRSKPNRATSRMPGEPPSTASAFSNQDMARCDETTRV